MLTLVPPGAHAVASPTVLSSRGTAIVGTSEPVEVNFLTNVRPPSTDFQISPLPEPVTPSPTRMVRVFPGTITMSQGLREPGPDSVLQVAPKFAET